MKNLYIDPTTKDICLKNFNLRFTSGNVEWLSQRIENEFKFFYGEWFADQTRGLEHFQKVLKKKVDINEVYSYYLNVLKNIVGVKSVENFEMDYVGNTRTLLINFAVISEDDETIERSFSL